MVPFLQPDAWQLDPQRPLCLQRGPGVRKPLEAEHCLVAPKHEGHFSSSARPSGWDPRISSTNGRRLGRNRDTLCLGGETTFSTGAARGTGNSASDSFHPGREQSARVKGEGSVPRCHRDSQDGQAGRMQDIRVFSRNKSVTVHEGDQT